MQNFIEQLLVGNLFAFLLVFMRFGIAIMLMPGIGDSFVSPQIRLLFALSVSFVLTPVLATSLPAVPASPVAFIGIMASEAFIGLFIGTIMRILMAPLDIAGNIVSSQMGLSAATMLNPTTEGQGAMISAVYSSLGVTILLATDLHHQILAAVVDSYHLYPAGAHLPDMADVAQAIGRIVTVAFRIGVQVSIPFIVVGTLIQMGFGVLGRLMPQLQIFFLALPAQIFLGFLMLSGTLAAGTLYWLNGYETVLTQSLTP